MNEWMFCLSFKWGVKSLFSESGSIVLFLYEFGDLELKLKICVNFVNF